MKYAIPAVALAAALAVPVSAQDSTVKSRTKDQGGRRSHRFDDRDACVRIL
jgi:hypothetical protein